MVFRQSFPGLRNLPIHRQWLRRYWQSQVLSHSVLTSIPSCASCSASCFRGSAGQALDTVSLSKADMMGMEGDNKQRGWVLVTGASSGIGADFARVFARKKRASALVARSRERLHALASELTKITVCGHGCSRRTWRGPAPPKKIRRALQADGIEVETLVNNAGFRNARSVRELDPRRQSEMISVNVIALTELCRVFVPQHGEPRARRNPQCRLNRRLFSRPDDVGILRHQGLRPFFHGGARERIAWNGVSDSCLCPGLTATGFQEFSGTTRIRLVRAGMPMTSLAVAKAGEKALARGSDLEFLDCSTAPLPCRFASSPFQRRL